MSSSQTFTFSAERFFPRRIYDLISDVRATDPVAAYKATQTRQPRKELAPDGKLLVLAADDPARGVTASAGGDMALTIRYDYLARIVRVLLGGVFDGVIGTPDVLEDLCLVQQVLRENSGPAFLDGKVFIGSMNRGGLLGSTFEMADTFTAFNVERAKHIRCDGVKMLLRIDPDSPDTARALERCARVITDVNHAQMIALIDCQPVKRTGERTWETLLDPDEWARAVGIAAALGETSTRTWLTVPRFEGMRRATEAATLPFLLTDANSPPDVTRLLADVSAAIGEARNIRGVAMGRNVLCPGTDDPLAVAGAIEAVVRRRIDPETILGRIDQARGRKMDALTSLLADKELVFEGGVQAAGYAT